MTYFKGSVWVLIFNLVFCVVLLYNCKSDRVTVLTNTKSEPLSIELQKVNKPSIDSLQKRYNFKEASQIFILSQELIEVSGLSYYKQNNSLVAINDEKGVFYELSLTDGKVLSKTKFHKKGDYEGLVYIEGQVVVSKNNGSLYFYDLQTKETEVIKTSLTISNDVEGLCYDPQERMLLLACKGQNTKTLREKTVKSIYGFSLDSFKLLEIPVLDVFDDELMEFVETTSKDQSKTELKKLKNRVKAFSPSGIAIHPTNNHVYILSARASTLLILDDKYNIHNIVFLRSNVIPQPEGICFDTEANLYISTEGQGFSGKIFKYNYQKQK